LVELNTDDTITYYENYVVGGLQTKPNTIFVTRIWYNCLGFIIFMVGVRIARFLLFLADKFFLKIEFVSFYSLNPA
jgi:hypothetical protein